MNSTGEVHGRMASTTLTFFFQKHRLQLFQISFELKYMLQGQLRHFPTGCENQQVSGVVAEEILCQSSQTFEAYLRWPLQFP